MRFSLFWRRQLGHQFLPLGNQKTRAQNVSDAHQMASKEQAASDSFSVVVLFSQICTLLNFDDYFILTVTLIAPPIWARPIVLGESIGGRERLNTRKGFETVRTDLSANRIELLNQFPSE